MWMSRMSCTKCKYMEVSNEGNNGNGEPTQHDPEIEVNCGLNLDTNIHNMEVIDNDDVGDTMEVSIKTEANMNFNDEHQTERSSLEMAVGNEDGQEFIGPFEIADSVLMLKEQVLTDPLEIYAKE